VVRGGGLANVVGVVGVAAGGAELPAGGVGEFDGEGEEAAGAEGGGGGGEEVSGVAEVDEDIGGDEEVIGVGAVAEGGDDFGDVEAVVDAAVAGEADHGGGEVDAGQRAGEGAEERAGQTGAAAEVKNVEIGSGADGIECDLDVLGARYSSFSRCWSKFSE